MAGRQGALLNPSSVSPVAAHVIGRIYVCIYIYIYIYIHISMYAYVYNIYYII